MGGATNLYLNLIWDLKVFLDIKFNLFNTVATTVVVGVRLMKRPLPRHLQQQLHPEPVQPTSGHSEPVQVSSPLFFYKGVSTVLQRILQFYMNQRLSPVTMGPHANQLHLDTSMPLQPHEPV